MITNEHKWLQILFEEPAFDSAYIESAPRQKKIKKLLFRADHRGTREMDILIGGFSRQALYHLSDEDLDVFRDILTWPEQTLSHVLLSNEPTSKEKESFVLDLIKLYVQKRSKGNYADWLVAP